MFETAAARATLRLSLAVFAVTALAGVWEVLTAQAPGSMLYIGVLPGPAQSLRESAFMLATVLFVVAQLFPKAFPADASRAWPSGSRAFVSAAYVAALCVLSSGIYGAFTGLHGEQLGDIRHDALPLFLVKHLGYVDLACVFGCVAWRALRCPAT